MEEKTIYNDLSAEEATDEEYSASENEELTAQSDVMSDPGDAVGDGGDGERELEADANSEADGRSESRELDDAEGDIILDELHALAEDFPELRRIKDVGELHDPLRYAALRDLGLSAREAYLATSGIKQRGDNRAHLGGSVPRRAASPVSAMSARELRAARELFTGVSDAELVRLYRRVTGN